MQEHLFSVARKYVIAPAKMLAANSSVLFAILALILVDYFSQPTGGSLVAPTGAWAFNILPKVLVSLTRRPLVLIIVAVAAIGKAIMATVVAQDMMAIYCRERIGLLQSAKKTSLLDVIWLISAELVVYSLFGMIALGFYVPTYFAWHTYHRDLSLLLFSSFFLLYPIFYMIFSTLAMASALPLNNHRKTEIIRFLISGVRLRKLYIFYFVRLALESTLLIFIPLVMMRIFHSSTLSILSIVLGLLAPFALFRGAAYEVKLNLLESDKDIYKIFKNHYVNNLI